MNASCSWIVSFLKLISCLSLPFCFAPGSMLLDHKMVSLARASGCGELVQLLRINRGNGVE